MVKLFELRDSEVIVVVDQAGQKEYLGSDGTRVFHDIVGGSVLVKRLGDSITCETVVPESKDSVHFSFLIKNSEIRADKVPFPVDSVRDLRQLIGDVRVALNGRL